MIGNSKICSEKFRSKIYLTSNIWYIK